MFTAIACLVISGLFNFLTHPGHTRYYHALFGMKILLALHVFAVAILIARPGNKRRNRQMFGAAISGLTVILISNYLKGIAWEVSDFSVDRYAAPLLALHRRGGPIEVGFHLFALVARRAPG